MAFGDSITITVNAVAKTLKKINWDNYSSEYLFRDTSEEYRMKIRHSNEKALIRMNPMQRHNVELQKTVYGVLPDTGYTVLISTTLRNPEKVSGAEVDYLSDGLADWVKANGVLLTGWES